MFDYFTLHKPRVRSTVTSIVSVCALLLSACRSLAEVPISGVETLPNPATKSITFVTDIKPVLEKSCFHCHGPDTQEAGLRLDTRTLAFKGADSGPVMVPGKSAESRLIHVVDGH